MTGPVTLEQPEDNRGSRAMSEASKSSPNSALNQTRALSPIVSPCQSPKPILKVDTNLRLDEDVPPQVPPKSPVRDRKMSPQPPLLSSPPSVLYQAIFTPGSDAVSSAISESASPYSKGLPLRSETPKPTEVLGSTIPSNGALKSTPAPVWVSHNRSASDVSILNRGRPMKRSDTRSRSRTRSKTKSPDTEVWNNWQLPRGLKVAEARTQLPASDKENLHQKARRQAEKFEVLASSDVTQLSRVSRSPFLSTSSNADLR